jgi:hypothetical protein
MFSNYLFKLFPVNILYTAYFIVFWKAENVVQVTKTPYNIIKQPLLPSTIHFYLKKAGIRAVIKFKCPFLFVKHYKAH